MQRFLPLCVAALASSALAQVDVLYTNISSTAGNYRDAIVLWTANGQRPLAQETPSFTGARSATGSVRKARYRVLGGVKYLYWHDTISDDIWRARDGNGNGVLDASEFEQVFDWDAASDGQLDERGGIWWATVAAGSGTARGVWKFQDLNNDGDFKDAGESAQVVVGPTFTFGGTTASCDQGTSCAILPNGDLIWHETDARCWFRTTPAGATSIFLAYRTAAAGAITPQPALNPDIGTVLPSLSAAQFDRVAVDPVSGDVFFAANFSSTLPHVFIARDGNADGDVNDAGEMKFFLDGTLVTPAWGPVDDLDFLNGAVYVSYENAPGGANIPSTFNELKDLNLDGDAQDPGELTVVGATPAGDDPTTIGITVVPAGTFGPSGINFDLRYSANLSTAGGSTVISYGDIPAALQNEGTSGYLLLSLTGDAALPVPLPPFNVVIGLTPDALFAISAGLFSAGPFTGATQAAGGTIVYPAGLPLGTKLYLSAIAIRASDFNIRGATGTAILEVK